jgi:hypothetical protein
MVLIILITNTGTINRDCPKKAASATALIRGWYSYEAVSPQSGRLGLADVDTVGQLQTIIK